MNEKKLSAQQIENLLIATKLVKPRQPQQDITKLSTEAEIELVECGNHDELMAYIAKFKLCNEAQEKLIRSGDEELIQLLLNRLYPGVKRA